ncbi:MAG TPA: hypothetical protein VF297_08640 [Pyrinomonadaceae bacterium]
MKKSTSMRLIPVLLLFAGVLSVAGCGDGLSCEGRQLPASWAQAKLPLLEGGTVCTWDGDKNAYLTYNGTEYFELHDKYAERLRNDGWKFSLGKQDRTFFAADKDGNSFTFGFNDCRRMVLLREPLLGYNPSLTIS